MNEPKKEFAEQLLACDRSTPNARANYEKELRAMLDCKLNAKQRRERLVAAVVLSFCALLMGHAAFEAFRARMPGFELPAFVGAYMSLTAAALVGIVIVLAIGVWRGGYPRWLHRKLVAGIAIAYVGLTGWIFMVASSHTPELFRNDLFVFGLILALYAATAWIRQRVGQAELTTREKLLEIELRLAEIAESLPPEDAAK
jgi:hypothetical protein